MKRNRYLLYAISCLQGMIFYGPIATLYRQAAGVSVFQITLIESISLALCIALEIPWGLAAERIGYKTTMTLKTARSTQESIGSTCAPAKATRVVL